MFTMDELRKLGENTIPFPIKPGQRYYGWWKEEKLEDYIQGRVFPNSWKLPATQKLLLERFWNFYFNGDIPSNCSVHGVVFPAITLAYSQDYNGVKFLFPDDYWGDNNYLFNVATEVENLTVDKPVMQTTYRSYSRNSNQESFRRNIYALITDWKITEDLPFNIIKLFNLTSFVAMTIFRSICKNETYLIREFQKREYLACINDVVNWPSYFHYAPPCESCINKSCLNLDKQNHHSTCMLAMILKLWKTQLQPARTILEKALLNSISYNGLLIIKYLHTVSSMFNLTLDEVIDGLSFITNIDNWDIIRNFQEHYLKNNETISTYPWARVIDDGYLMDYRISCHRRLGAVLAGIISRTPNGRGIERSTWMQSNNEIISSFFEVGKNRAYDKLESLSAMKNK